MPFEDSRRLTGYNLYFSGVGAVLEAVGASIEAPLLAAWRDRVTRMRAALDWPPGEAVARVHAGGASLAIAAPLDQLLTATEVNEWALLASLARAGRSGADGAAPADPAVTLRARGAGAADPPCETFHAPGHAAAWDEQSAVATLRAAAHAERRPDLVALVRAAEARGLTVLIDEETVSFGAGAGACDVALDALPALDSIGWHALLNVPIALVTGSNGKTTTVRLLAALLRAHGWASGHSCTDGLFVDGVETAGGDFSGPAGARAILRDARVEAAVLETARGGILRRGIAVQRADVAIVTNVSDDHFGEYGIHDLDGLADVKLAVARTIDATGLLVVNADDARLAEKARALACPLAWFALDAAHPLLHAARSQGSPTAGVRAGRLVATFRGGEHDLGAAADMPLAFGGSASYNVANLAAASLAALQLGVAAPAIAGVLARFGSAHADNPGRLQHWALGGADVFLDYAHNPQGLRGLLAVASAASADGRLGLLLGQAGNREDAEIRELAAVAAEFAPARIVLKDIAAMLRGRAPGAVPRILAAALREHGVAPDRIVECLDEVAAARGLLEWMRSGDRVVLPVHSVDARQRISALLDRMAVEGWRTKGALPA